MWLVQSFLQLKVTKSTEKRSISLNRSQLFTDSSLKCSYTRALAYSCMRNNNFKGNLLVLSSVHHCRHKPLANFASVTQITLTILIFITTSFFPLSNSPGPLFPPDAWQSFPNMKVHLQDITGTPLPPKKHVNQDTDFSISQERTSHINVPLSPKTHGAGFLQYYTKNDFCKLVFS